jgi:hypothetical protein
MSALGQKQTLSDVSAMSALPPKADITGQQLDVRFVPKADILRCGKGTPLFDHLVGAQEDSRRQPDADRLGRFQVYHQLELCWLLNG